MDDTQERLEAIAKLADSLTDFLSGDGWSRAWAIRQLAEGRWTPAEAFEYTEED